MNKLYLSDDDFNAVVLVCKYVIDQLENSSTLNPRDVQKSISSYARLIDLLRSKATFNEIEIKNLIRACDAFISDMRGMVSFMDDPVMRAETRKYLRHVESLHSKLSAPSA